MLTFYLITGIVGGSLIVLSAVGGLGDHDIDIDHDVDIDMDMDADVDVDVDVDADVDADGGDLDTDTWLPFLSLRFWTYACAGFGVTGGVLTALGTLGAVSVGIMSGGAGLFAGLTMAYAMRALKRGEAHEHVTDADYEGVEGRVRVAIQPGAVGKIRVKMRGEDLDLLATSDEPEALPIDTPIVIIEMNGPQAKVVHRATLIGG